MLFMIQKFLAEKLRDVTERTTLFAIQTETGITTSSLSRLMKQEKASIKTCERLLEYFNETAADRFAAFATVRAVEKIIGGDDGLAPVERDFLVLHFRTGYKFVTTTWREKVNG